MKQSQITLMIVILLLGGLSISGATYKGKNIDGKKYGSSVKTGKVIVSCDIMFDGKAVYIYSDVLTTGKLWREVISDQHDIEIAVGDDTWTIDITVELP